MGRSPHSKPMEGLNKGAWTVVEDQILEDYIKSHGEGRWGKIPKETGLKRCGKSCRLRWLNYLRPDIKRGNISQDEEDLIIRLHRLLGNRWSLIAGRLPGRTDNEIKNYWYSTLSKKVQGGEKCSKKSKREDPIKELPSNEAAPLPIMDSYLTQTKPNRCDSNDGNVPPESLLEEYLGTNNTLVEPAINGVLENMSKEGAESDFTTCGSDDTTWDFMMDLNERQISFSEVLQSDFLELCADDRALMVEDFSNDYKNWSLPSSLDENHLFSQELL